MLTAPLGREFGRKLVADMHCRYCDQPLCQHKHNPCSISPRLLPGNHDFALSITDKFIIDIVVVFSGNSSSLEDGCLTD